MKRKKLDARITEKFFFTVLLISTILVILPILWVFLTILKHGLPVISWDFLSQIPGANASGGIFPAIVGTVALVVLTVAISLPVGLGAAIYIHEYAAKNRLSRLIKVAILNLAGVPSIVYGLFGLALFVIAMKLGRSLLAGSLTLSLMILPVIITASREALESVPDSFREVSLSLGASKWQTIRYAVLPNALPGILTGTILGIGRAAGETAPILFIASAWFPKAPTSVWARFMALPYYLFVTATLVGNTIKNPDMPYGIALVLIMLVFFITLPAIIIRANLRRKKHW